MESISKWSHRMIIDSTQFVVDNSDHVKLGKEEDFEKLIDEMAKEKCEESNMELHRLKNDSNFIDLIFIVDALNFSFWKEDVETKTIENNTIDIDRKRFTGYASFCNFINQLIEKNVPIWSPEFYHKLTIDEWKKLEELVDENLDIPMKEERVRICQEAGKILVEEFGGSFSNFLKLGDNSAMKCLCLLWNNFPFFRDFAHYKGKIIYFMKKPQILISDLHSQLPQNELCQFNDINLLTMFADYRVPQILVHFSTIKYSEELLNKINNGHLFESGESMEVEIRSASIIAVEKLVKLFEERQKSKLKAIDIDYVLWRMAKKYQQLINNSPVHKIRCRFY
ncbi:hypothetical protein SNEBB_008239 [Seison nebaliae]|nr:hypothetical protein SNEBB_008239 [Seison nebaliae]